MIAIGRLLACHEYVLVTPLLYLNSLTRDSTYL